jgi:hypothetical protein
VVEAEIVLLAVGLPAQFLCQHSDLTSTLTYRKLRITVDNVAGASR